MQAAFHALAKHGSLVFVGGSADPNYGFHLPLREVTLKGIKLLGCVMGDSVPHEVREDDMNAWAGTSIRPMLDVPLILCQAIPQLIRYYREGSFPLDKLVKYYKVSHVWNSGQDACAIRVAIR